MKGIKHVKMIKKIFFAWILFLVFCALVPPLIHKKAADGQDAVEEYGDSEACERALVIDDNTEALLWRLRLIENAKERIVLVTFEFWDDNSGTDIMAALLAAAERGVQVQVMVDGIGGVMRLGGSGHFRELTSHPNVEVRFYNTISLLTPWRANYRMHDKYLIADDFAYLLGGRNTGDLFLGNYKQSYNEDRDILVYETEPGKGSSYCQLLEHFEQVWNLPCCRTYKGFGRATKELSEHYLWMRKEYKEAFEEVDWLLETQETEGLTLLSGEIGPYNKRPQLWQALVEKMQGESDILMITPYIICSRDMYRDMEALSENGAKLQVFINAVESGANPFGCTDYLNQKKRILGVGAEVCEYWGEQSLHTKTVLLGEHTSIVGSCNIDMRSIYLDTELMLVIESGQINQELREKAETMKVRSKIVSSDGTWQTGKDYNQEPIPFGKKLLYGVLRILIIPFRQLL